MLAGTLPFLSCVQESATNYKDVMSLMDLVVTSQILTLMKTLICAVASNLLTPLRVKGTNKDVFLGTVPRKPKLL